MLCCSVVSDPLEPCQAPLSMEFSRQQWWSGLPFPPPGDLLDSGIKPTSLVSPAPVGRIFAMAPHEWLAEGHVINEWHSWAWNQAS